MHSATKSAGKSRQAAGELAILQAAERLFALHGYSGVSMRAVAHEAGVSKANIYHHFNSKESLYQAIVRSSVAETDALIDRLANSSGDFDQRLVEFAASHLEHLFDRKYAARVILREAFSGDKERSKKLSEDVFSKINQRMVSIMRAGQKAGVLRKDLDPALCVILLLGANAFFFQAQEILKHFPEADFASHANYFSKGMADVLLNGMLDSPGARKKGESRQ